MLREIYKLGRYEIQLYLSENPEMYIEYFTKGSRCQKLNMNSCRSSCAIIVIIIACNSLTNADMSVSDGSSYVSEATFTYQLNRFSGRPILYRRFAVLQYHMFYGILIAIDFRDYD